MDFGQWSAATVVVGIVLVAATANAIGAGAQGLKRDLGYFGAGLLFAGLVSCVLVSAGVSIHFS